MKLKYVIIVLIALLSFSSCNDWLDVVPQGQVQGEDLLTDEKGYNSALDGIYYKLTSGDTLRDGIIVRDDGRVGSILGFVHEDEESLLQTIVV